MQDPEGSRTFRVFATANTVGRGDATGLYSGTNLLNAAFLDRFVVVKMDYPSEEVELDIVRGRSGLNRDTVELMVRVARQTRRASADQALVTSPVSTRQLVVWGRAMAWLHGSRPKRVTFSEGEEIAKQAWRMAVINKLDDEDTEVFNGILQRMTGVRL